MSLDPVQTAVARSEAAAAVLEKHRAEIYPHVFVLLAAFGPVLTRNIVSGIVEGAIIADERQRRAAVVPFSEGPK